MAMEENREEDVDSSRRRVWESPYVRREDGEFEPIQAKDKSPAISEKTVGVRTFGESVQKGHMKSPGDIVGIGKMEHEVAKLRSELRSKSAVQLKEAVARQSKLLENKALVSRLPDKGEKCRYGFFIVSLAVAVLQLTGLSFISCFYRLSLTVMKQLLSERRKEEDLEVGMEKMKISTERMEWKNRLLDSDDDSDPEKDPEDPLAVLAQGLVPHTSTRAKSIPTNEIPTQDEDRTENGNSNVLGARQAEVEKFATAQASRVDLVLMPHNRFTPHSSVKQTALDPELRHRLGAGGTSSKPEGSPSPKPGTPNMPLPPTYSNTTCLLTLGDSLRLQQEQEKRVREAQVN